MTPGAWSNGLIRPLPFGALVFTGISHGRVRVCAAVTDREPPDVEPGPWEEIVDVSVTAPYGQLRVDSYDKGPPAELPSLSPGGAGTYRLRVHAQGRDLHYDQVHSDPGEAYLIIGWPSPPAPERILRSTDRCGRSLRQTQPPSLPEPSADPVPAHAQDEMRTRARNHDALLGLIAQYKSGEQPDGH
ncbi:hypothetical protein ACQPZF_27280 [Actinosynnema sp. CS-041913]|uniref:hypothetical protein n=1 Tax=Actinosynnema sp. CS-041913 TaxID=3239917 RepID=UPI003D90F421